MFSFIYRLSRRLKIKFGAFHLWLLLWALEAAWGQKKVQSWDYFSYHRKMPDSVILLTPIVITMMEADKTRDCVTGNGGWKYKMDMPKLSQTNVGQACLMLLLLTVLRRRVLWEWEYPVCL